MEKKQNTNEEVEEIEELEELKEIELMDSEIDALKKQSLELMDRYQRTLAEFDNFRKRAVKEKSAMFDEGATDIINGLLPTIDNFERAFQSIPLNEEETPFAKGMKMVYRQMMEFLEKKNIQPIQAVGETFDPLLHSAVSHIDDENYGEQEIVEDMQRGYMYKNKVLRHSVVKVAN